MLVPETGLEPALPERNSDLNAACLPVPPLRHSAGVLGRIRTYDLWLRKPTLYPAELRGLKTLTIYTMCTLFRQLKIKKQLSIYIV
jgi:hypothetical protein